MGSFNFRFYDLQLQNMLKFYDLCSMNLFLFIQIFILTNFNIRSSFQEKVELRKSYSKQFKGVNKTKICVFEKRIEFLCPYYAADAVPPYPHHKEKTKDYTECCHDKCCTKEEYAAYLKHKAEQPDWCYDWLYNLGFCKIITG